MNVSKGDVAYTTRDVLGTCGGEPCVVLKAGTVVIVASLDWAATFRSLRTMWHVEPQTISVQSQNYSGTTELLGASDRILRRIKPSDDKALKFRVPKELVKA